MPSLISPAATVGGFAQSDDKCMYTGKAYNSFMDYVVYILVAPSIGISCLIFETSDLQDRDGMRGTKLEDGVLGLSVRQTQGHEGLFLFLVAVCM
jgi:hypothetical protein